MTTFPAIPITDNVYWVGAVDWAIRDFHGYRTPCGSTYNAYLVVGEKIALVDTVKSPFCGEMLARIASVVEPSRVDYIIANHAEVDHSGSLPQAIAAIQPERVFASTLGVKALAGHFHMAREMTAVKDGETLGLGGLTLTFAEMRMLHWPDSMATYVAERSLLLSNDAFGMHLATSERFDDELDPSLLDYEAGKYYANILMPFGALIPKAAEKLTRLGPITAIAPSHGPVWRKNPGHIIERYANWAAAKKSPMKAVVAFDTMWESTAKMAKAIAEGLTAEGAVVKLFPLRATHRSDVVAEVLDASAIIIGSPTLNNTIFPTVADLLTYLKGLKPKNMIGAAFGSHGWSGEGVGQLEAALTEMKIPLAAEGMKVVYVPDEAALTHCFSSGQEIARKMKERS